MDEYLAAVTSHLRLAEQTLHLRLAKLERIKSRDSRHYNRLQHTRSMLLLVQELRGMSMQDPDMWDDEPDLVPF